METPQSTSAPPSKWLKTEQNEAVVPSGKGSNRKFTNSDLPDGCREGGTWRSFISSLVHWCGGHVDPWSVEPTKLQDAMQQMWSVVYHNEIDHEVTLKGAVYHVVS